MKTLSIPKIYIARRNIFSWLGINCKILSITNELLAFVHMKAFKFKEEITVYRDENQGTRFLTIDADQVIDFSASYRIRDFQEAENIGSVRRRGWKSLLRDEWAIFDNRGTELAVIREDSMAFALLRRFLSNLIPQTYHVLANGDFIGEIKGTWNPFVVKYDVDFSYDKHNRVDPRLLLAGVILLMTIEGKQGGSSNNI